MAERSSDDLTPEEGVDRFLSAPESVLRSEQESRKLALRKARLRADEEQLRALKSTERPTMEDLLADILRVAEDRDTNPYWQFRTVSRKRYRLFGHYPVEFVDQQFGQFEHAKQVAGLEDEPGTRAKKAAIAEKSRREHAGRYLERCVLPHVLHTRDGVLSRELTQTRLVLSISDTHATFLDPFVWWCFLSACIELEPDVVYFNGDILEGSEISRYPKIPGWTIPLQLEFDFAREMFRQVRQCVPAETEVVWGAGNHGIDRIVSYLSQVAPAFSGLRSMRFDQLADLGNLRVHLSQGGTIASPAGQEDQAPGSLLYGFYRIHHGTRLGQSPAAEELKEAGRSGQSGHVHRAQLAYGTSEADMTRSWMTTPMGCTEKAGRSYMKGVSTGWQRGFGIAFLSPGGLVRQYPVVCDDGHCVVEGRVFKRAADLPDMDVRRLWLEDFEVPA